MRTMAAGTFKAQCLRVMILLDTHVWIWLAAEPERLSRRASSAIRRAARSGGIAIASIAATARAEGLPLVTKDERIRSSPLLRTVW